MKMLKPISERLLEAKNNAMLFKDGAEPLECTINFQDLKDAIALIELLKTSAKEKDQRIENMEKIIEDQQERIDIMAEGGWISIEKKLPDDRGYFLGWVNGDIQFVLYDPYSRHEKWNYCDIDGMQGEVDDLITHWMPLPEPPKEVSEND